MSSLTFGRIYFINAKFKVTEKRKAVVKELKGIVWTANKDMTYDRKRVLKEMKIAETSVKLFDVEILKDLGEPMQKASQVSKVKKSDVTRNEVTGAYE